MSEELGVTGESPAPDVAAPAAEAPSASTDVQDAPSASEASPHEEVLPFGKHPRWQQMVKEKRELQSKLRDFETRSKDLEGAAAVQKWLQEDPKGLRKYLDSLIPAESTPQEDPYAKWEPEVAAKFRELDELKAKISKAETDWQQKSEAEKVQAIQTNRVELDKHFDILAQKAGFDMSNEKLMKFIANATLSLMTGIAKNPQMVTKTELEKAFADVVEGSGQIEKLGLKKKVSAVPPSGSSQGSIPTGKTKKTEQDRINDIVASLISSSV